MNLHRRSLQMALTLFSFIVGLGLLGLEAAQPRATEVELVQATTVGKVAKLKVTSPAFESGGMYPVEFTCDGAGISPPIEWTGAPAETKSYALQLWHTPKKGDTACYWVVYNIPATTTKLPKNVKGVGKAGFNDKGKAGYQAMCSKGPGVKEYHITVHALSAEPKFTTDKVTRSDLLAAIKEITIAEGTLSYKYERPAGKTGN